MRYEVKKHSKWYAIPPYDNEGWKIFDENGELVATFETKEDCVKAVTYYNDVICFLNKWAKVSY